MAEAQHAMASGMKRCEWRRGSAAYVELAQLCVVAGSRCDGYLLRELERRQVGEEVALHPCED